MPRLNYDDMDFLRKNGGLLKLQSPKSPDTPPITASLESVLKPRTGDSGRLRRPGTFSKQKRVVFHRPSETEELHYNQQAHLPVGIEGLSLLREEKANARRAQS